MDDAAFDPLIHAPQRLRICAILDAASYVEFGELEERLGVSKSALSKHLTLLAEAGLTRDTRVTVKGRSRLQVSFTDSGREKYRAHKEALKRILMAS